MIVLVGGCSLGSILTRKLDLEVQLGPPGSHRIMFGMFPFAFWVFSTPKCEAVIFAKFRLACMPSRPLKFLDGPIYLEHMCHAHACM